jgi:hypothetical protein
LNLHNTWWEHERLQACYQASWRNLSFIMCTFSSGGLGSWCMLIFLGARNSHHSLKTSCQLFPKITNFIILKSTRRLYQKIWSPFWVVAWFAWTFLREESWHMYA